MSFLIDKLKERVEFIEKNASDSEKKEMLTELHDTFQTMDSAGVSNENDYRDFFYIMAHVPKMAKDSGLSKNQIAEASHIVFENRAEFPINTVYNFYKAVEAAVETIKKEAYPQGFEGNYIKSPHNLTKWVQAMREIYAFKTRGLDHKEAFKKVTERWNPMEKKDFKHWLDFYESNSHLSYKLAENQPGRVYYDFGGGIAPIGGMETPRARVPMAPMHEEMHEDMQQQQQKQEESPLSEKVRQLIGRLNSAEKIYTSNDFQKLLGPEHEAWLATLHQLKRKIQTSPLKNASTVDDLIERFGNQLRAKGMHKTASTLLKIAQPALGMGGDPMGGDPMGGLPMDASPAGNDDKNDPEAAMDEFLKGMGVRPDKDREKFEKHEKQQYEKEQEESGSLNMGSPAPPRAAPPPVGEGVAPMVDDVNDAEIVVSEDDYDLYKQAQIGAPPEPTPPKPEKSPLANPDDVGDNKIEEALKDITLTDVINKLEGLTQLYKNRPLARELTIVDLMMQQLGIASYFPNMAEATKSALDSNQYVLTRIEDILAKLRGANAVETGQLTELQNKLEEAEQTAAKKREQSEAAQTAPAPEEGPPGAPPAPSPAPEGPPSELAGPAPEVVPPGPGVRV